MGYVDLEMVSHDVDICMKIGDHATPPNISLIICAIIAYDPRHMPHPSRSVICHKAERQRQTALKDCRRLMFIFLCSPIIMWLNAWHAATLRGVLQLRHHFFVFPEFFHVRSPQQTAGSHAAQPGVLQPQLP